MMRVRPPSTPHETFFSPKIKRVCSSCLVLVGKKRLDGVKRSLGSQTAAQPPLLVQCMQQQQNCTIAQLFSAAAAQHTHSSRSRLVLAVALQLGASLMCPIDIVPYKTSIDETPPQLPTTYSTESTIVILRESGQAAVTQWGKLKNFVQIFSSWKNQ